MEKQNFNIAIIYMLCDALERKLIEFNALDTLKRTEAMVAFDKCQYEVIKLRKFMDKNLREFAEMWGEEADNINDIIENYIKEKQNEL